MMLLAAFVCLLAGVHAGPVMSTRALQATASAPCFITSYMGCYADRFEPDRAILHKMRHSDNMTVETCRELAIARNKSYFALQYGRECWGAGPNRGLNATIWGISTDCNYTCTGNSAETCGGWLAFNLYSLKPCPAPPSPPSPPGSPPPSPPPPGSPPPSPPPPGPPPPNPPTSSGNPTVTPQSGLCTWPPNHKYANFLGSELVSTAGVKPFTVPVITIADCTSTGPGNCYVSPTKLSVFVQSDKGSVYTIKVHVTLISLSGVKSVDVNVTVTVPQNGSGHSECKSP